MASTACALEKSTLPAGSPVSVSWELTPGELALTVSATWDAAAPEFAGRKDFLLSIDRQLVYRGRAWDQLPGLWGPAPDTWVGKTQTFKVRLKTDYFGWSPGYHQVTYGHLFNYNPNEYTRYEASFGLTLPPAPLAPQSPAPAFAPGKVLRNLFFLSNPTPEPEPGLNAGALRDAGINCLTVAGFQNPGTATYAQWQAGWDAQILSRADWCAANGFHCLVEMDALYRSSVERAWWDTCPWRDDVVRHVRDTFAARRPWVAAVSGNDECIWSNGVPIDTRALHALWRENPEAPPWAWPGPNPQAYETADQADYAIRYVTGSGAEFSSKLSASGLGWSLAQRARAFDTMRLRPPPPPGWPLATSTHCMSGNYQKLVDGCFLQALPSPDVGDVVLDEQVLPAQAAAAAWLPLVFLRPLPALLRGYYFDTRTDRARRRDAIKQPAGMLQQGLVYGTDLWRAFGRAWKSVEARESLLTTRTPLTPNYLDSWATGGVDGLEVAVNCAPFARTWRGVKVPAGGVWLSDGEVL